MLHLAPEMCEPVIFTEAEMDRISRFRIPGESTWGDNIRSTTRFPRRPVVDVRQWRENHARRLRDLERWG